MDKVRPLRGVDFPGTVARGKQGGVREKGPGNEEQRGVGISTTAKKLGQGMDA